MDVYIIGQAVHRAADVIDDMRLEEIAYRTARAALDNAGIQRREIDHVTLAACDELDGRSITSMLLAAPAGAYLKDEMRVTDSGLAGLQLGAMRVGAGDLQLGLVVSWNQSSVGPVEDAARMCAEPFYLRPIGMNYSIADGLFANASAHRYGYTMDDAAQRVRQRLQAAALNPRAIPRDLPSGAQIAASAPLAYPLRSGHRAPLTDGAVAMVLASGDWLRSHPQVKPLARIAAFSSNIDRYQLDQDRLCSLDGFKNCLADVLARAELEHVDAIDVVELDAQTAWYDLAFTEALGASERVAISPSGGSWAQNPFFCNGLLNAAEAVWQVAGAAGPLQVAGARRALAHGSYGFAQQAHGFVLVEGVAA
jgi:acetyl-CoA acetyltransferase